MLLEVYGELNSLQENLLESSTAPVLKVVAKRPQRMHPLILGFLLHYQDESNTNMLKFVESMTGSLLSLSWFIMEWYSFQSVTRSVLACLRWRKWKVEVHMVPELTPVTDHDSQLSLSWSKHFIKGSTLQPSQRSSSKLLNNAFIYRHTTTIVKPYQSIAWKSSPIF